MQPVGFAGGIDPDLRRTAADQRGIGFQRIGHGLELAAQFDQQAIAFVAFEEFIFFGNV